MAEMKNDCGAVMDDKLVIIGKMLPKIRKNTDKRNTKRIKGLKAHHCHPKKQLSAMCGFPIYNKV